MVVVVAVAGVLGVLAVLGVRRVGVAVVESEAGRVVRWMRCEEGEGKRVGGSVRGRWNVPSVADPELGERTRVLTLFGCLASSFESPFERTGGLSLSSLSASSSVALSR